MLPAYTTEECSWFDVDNGGPDRCCPGCLRADNAASLLFLFRTWKRWERLVFPPGFAPRPTPSHSAMLLLHHGNGKWRPPPELHRALVRFRDALICLSYTARGGNGPTGGTCTRNLTIIGRALCC